MSKHTPGPWKYQPAHLTNDLLEVDENYIRITAGDGYLENGFEVTGFMRPANARLIEAAPEMYDMLKAFAAGTPPVYEDMINLLNRINP